MTGTWSSTLRRISSRTSPSTSKSPHRNRVHHSSRAVGNGKTSDWREEVGLCSSTAREGERRGHVRVQMVVFVHGYNVNQTQSTAWFAEAFKRLYQSGAHSMFTGVQWNGAVSQVSVAGLSPNYWTNVDNAFLTSQALVSSVNSLPGGTNKIMIAHSLGNMVVSSALNDYGTNALIYIQTNALNVSQYFMLDAAMATETVDPNTFGDTNNMVFTGYAPTTGLTYAESILIPSVADPVWKSYNHNLWAAYWHTLFPPYIDGRSGLTWSNRFSTITANANVTIYNFWSSGEDVLDNASNGVFGPPAAELAWADQEMSKGTDLQATASHLNLVDSTIIQQGGWGMNPSHETSYTNPMSAAVTYFPMPASQANSLASTNISLFKTNTFFTPFSDDALTGPTGSTEALKPNVLNQTLAEAIPALSFAVGRNAFRPIVNTNNFDMVKLEDVSNGIPQGSSYIDDDHIYWAWHHSDAKDVAYPFTHNLWQNLVTTGQLNKP